MAPLVLRVLLALKAIPEVLAPREPLALRALLAHKEAKVLREPKETSAPLDL